MRKNRSVAKQNHRHSATIRGKLHTRENVSLHVHREHTRGPLGLTIVRSGRNNPEPISGGEIKSKIFKQAATTGRIDTKAGVVYVTTEEVKRVCNKLFDA
jgi:hypothetical protein